MVFRVPPYQRVAGTALILNGVIVLYLQAAKGEGFDADAVGGMLGLVYLLLMFAFRLRSSGVWRSLAVAVRVPFDVVRCSAVACREPCMFVCAGFGSVCAARRFRFRAPAWRREKLGASLRKGSGTASSKRKIYSGKRPREFGFRSVEHPVSLR